MRFIDEDGDERWAWATVPPELTPGHFDLPEVRDAVQFAAQAYSQAETDKGLLGRGNFGVAFLVETQAGGAVVVKLPAPTNIHGKPWSSALQRENLMHEAGVANELQALGVRLVPATVYVEFPDGRPALVREYGEPVTKMSVDEFAEIERALMAAEELGWAVEDYIDLYRRPDGSVFVGDVGIWHPLPKWESGKPTRKAAEESLPWLIPQLAGRVLGPRYEKMPTLARMIELTEQMREDMASVEEKPVRRRWIDWHIEYLRDAVSGRQELGLPVPAESVRVLAEAERFLVEERG